MDIKKFSQIWNYFKKGRGEIGLVLSLYSMLLSYSIKFNVDFTIAQYGIMTLVFGVGCTLLGVFLAEKQNRNHLFKPVKRDSS